MRPQLESLIFFYINMTKSAKLTPCKCLRVLPRRLYVGVSCEVHLMARFLRQAFLDLCIPFWERVQNVKDINKEFRDHTCEYKNALSRKNKYSWKNLKHPFKGFSGLKKRIEQSEMPFDVKYEATGIISRGYSCT